MTVPRRHLQDNEAQAYSDDLGTELEQVKRSWSGEEPRNPVKGQLWFDEFGGEKRMYFYDNDQVNPSAQFQPLATGYTYRLYRALPTTVDDFIELGQFSVLNGSAALDVAVTVASGSDAIISKTYSINIAGNGTNGAWQIATPGNSTGVFGGNDFELEIKTGALSAGSSPLNLRLRRSNGTDACSAYCYIVQKDYSGAFTESETTGTASPVPSTFYFVESSLPKSDGTFQSYIYTPGGFEITQDSGLDGEISAGVAFIAGTRVDHAGESKTFTASKETYVDLGKDGTIDYTEITPFTTAPALAAGHIRLGVVSTDGSGITTIQQNYSDRLGNKVYPVSPLEVVSGGQGSSLVSSEGRPEDIEQRWQDFDFVGWMETSGFIPTTVGTLTTTIPDYFGYVARGLQGLVRVETAYGSAGLEHTFTASKDTYIDIDLSGELNFTEVSNGANEPPEDDGGTGGSVRIAKVVTDGTEVTDVDTEPYPKNGLVNQWANQVDDGDLLGTGASLGNGTVKVYWARIGRFVAFNLVFTHGSSSSMATSGTTAIDMGVVAFPFSFSGRYNFLHPVSQATLVDANGSSYPATAAFNSDGVLILYAHLASGTYVSNANITTTAPFTWANGDQILISGFIESTT